MATIDPEAQTVGSLSADEIENAVASIIASGVLGTGDRRARLLRYLVDQEVAGKGDQIKAFTIAVDVLGRDASFDPNTDSIVRSEVRRLREALRLYFAEKAPPDSPFIEIPKGTYRPSIIAPAVKPDPGPAPLRFNRLRVWLAGAALFSIAVVLGIILLGNTDDPSDDVDAPLLSDLPYDVVRIVLGPVEAKGTHPDVQRLAFGVYSEMPMELSAYPWISVVAPLGGYDDVAELNADYVLQSSVFWENDTLIWTAKLASLPAQNVIWAYKNTIETTVRSIEASMIDVSTSIAQELGPLHGIAPKLVKSKNARSSAAGLEAFLCFYGFYEYLGRPTDKKHLELRKCLTKAVEQHPKFGDGWAGLALIHMDEARFGHNPRGGDVWKDAGHAIEQALTYEPLRMPVLNAALIYAIEAPQRDLNSFKQHANRLIELFPRHPSTLLNVGSRRAEFAGEWTEGLKQIEHAIELHPDPPSVFFITAAHKALLGNDDAELLRTVQTPDRGYVSHRVATQIHCRRPPQHARRDEALPDTIGISGPAQ